LLGAGAAPSPAAPGRASPAGCCGVGAGAACAPVAGAAGAGDRNGCSGGGSGGGGGSAPRSHAGAAGRAEGPAPAGSTARSAAAGGVAAGGSGCSQGAGRGGGGGCGSASPKLAPWPGPGAPPRLAVRSCTTAPGSGGALLGPSPAWPSPRGAAASPARPSPPPAPLAAWEVGGAGTAQGGGGGPAGANPAGAGAGAAAGAGAGGGPEGARVCAAAHRGLARASAFCRRKASSCAPAPAARSAQRQVNTCAGIRCAGYAAYSTRLSLMTGCQLGAQTRAIEHAGQRGHGVRVLAFRRPASARSRLLCCLALIGALRAPPRTYPQALGPAACCQYVLSKGQEPHTRMISSAIAVNFYS